MKPDLCISIRFVQPFALFHGRRDAQEPEWPPSPMRVYQALLNAASLRVRGKPLAPEVRRVLQALEVLCPQIIAPPAAASTVGRRAYVPHNQTDLVLSAWHRGNCDASIASHRMEKDIHPMRIEAFGEDMPTLYYLYPLDATTLDPEGLVCAIRPTVRAITHLGWGIDQVAADVTLVDRSNAQLTGERWVPSERSGRRLRVPRTGSLKALIERHEQFLSRLSNGNWTPVTPLSAVDQLRYRRDTDPVPPRLCAVFKLADENGDTVAYPHAKLIHVAGMVKHAAIDLMRKNPPRDLRGRTHEDWLRSYVSGHQSKEDKATDAPHTQVSYVPLPSVGHAHTDPGVRRVMIIAPIGDDDWLEHLARMLDGQMLKPLPNTHLPEGTLLQRVADRMRDGVRDAYTRQSCVWASFTPVILPGHDDHKPDKTRKLILKALVQSGIDQPCRFEWSAFSQFCKSYSAHKYTRDESVKDGKRRIGYIRPDHLLDQTAVHLRLEFDYDVPGPITVGAGRHCGFGLMAACR